MYGVRNRVSVEPRGEILHDGKKASEVRLFSQQLSLAIIYVYSECVPQCLSTYECVCARLDVSACMCGGGAASYVWSECRQLAGMWHYRQC